MSNSLYDGGREGFLDGSIDWDTDTIKIRCLPAAYAVNLSTHRFLSDVAPAAIGTDQTLASKTVNSPVGGVADAADVSYLTLASGSTITYMILYKDTGVAGTSRLIYYIDTASGLPYPTNGGNLLIQWDNGANRIFKL